MKPSVWIAAGLLVLGVLAATAGMAAERGVDVTVAATDGSYPGSAVVEPDPMQTAWIIRYNTPFGYSGVLRTDPVAGTAFLNAAKRTIDLRGRPRLFGDGRMLGPASPEPETRQPKQAPPGLGLQPPQN